MSYLRHAFVLLSCSLAVTLRRLVKGPRVAGWTRRFEVIVALVRRESRRQSNMSPARVRAEMLSAPIPRSLRDCLRWETSTIAGCPVETHTPVDWSPGELSVLYLHGGGYALCSPATHRALCARIAAASGARMIALDYRLAPEHPFPAGLEDVCAVWQSLAQADAPCAVAGDSAGGGLALALMLRLREAGAALPDFAVLLSPWVDLTCASASIDTNKDDYLQRHMLERFAAYYAPQHALSQAEVSPLFADLGAFPPCLVLTGGSEVFLDENRALTERLRAAGCKVELLIGEGMIHVWPAFAPVLPAGKEAIAHIGRFMRVQAAAGQRAEPSRTP